MDSIGESLQRTREGRIERVFPGANLIYIRVKNPDLRVGAVPGAFRIRNKDGGVRPYRGEDLRKVGIEVGARVIVTHDKEEGTVCTVIPRRNLLSRTANFLRGKSFG